VKFFIVLFVLILPVEGFAMEPAEDNLKDSQQAAYRIRNNVSCGKWIERRSSSDNYGQKIYKWWAMGFMSGINLMEPTYQDIAPQIDNESVYFWLDKYCKEKPLKTIGQGLQKFYTDFLLETCRNNSAESCGLEQFHIDFMRRIIWGEK